MNGAIFVTSTINMAYMKGQFPFTTLALTALMIFTLTDITGQREIIAFERMGSEGALPDASVVFEDSDGYIWMGSHDGLYRYDGSDYTTYRYDPDDPGSISGNRINCLIEDELGRLWVGTFGYGLNISDVRKHKFRQIHFDVRLEDDEMLNIQDLCQDVEGNIWVSTGSAVFILNEIESSSNGAIEVYELSIVDGPESNKLQKGTISSDSSSRIWIGTDAGLYMYDLMNGEWYYPADFPALGDCTVYDIQCDNANRIWVSTSGEKRLWVLDDETMKFSHYDRVPFSFENTSVKFCFDKDGRIWASEFGNALLGYDVENDRLFLNNKENSNAQYLRFWRTPYADAAGNVWVCSDGVFKYPYPQGFRNYLFDLNNDNSVSALHSNSTHLWIALRETGLLRYDLNTDQTTLLSIEDGLYSNLIYSLLPIGPNALLLGEYGAIQLLQDGQTIFTSTVPGSIRHMYRDANGRIWANGNAGMFEVNLDSRSVTKIDLSETLGSGSLYLQTIAEDPSGRLWFGSEFKGFVQFDYESNTVIQFHPGQSVYSFPSWRVNDLTAGAGDIMWVGTDVGLVKFNCKDYSWTLYNKNDGFNQDFIASVIYADSSGVWVSTNEGISHLNPTTDSISNYNSADGLVNVFYYPRVKLNAPSGLIMFGGRKGVDYFDPGQIRNNPFPPQVKVTSIEIPGYDTIDPQVVELSEGLTVPYHIDLIKIDFQAQYHSAPNAVTYKYQIEGLSNEWYDLGNRSELNMTGLGPDDYVVRIRAVSPDGVRDVTDLAIPITINPPFWSTTWFRIAALLTIGLCIFYWIQRRERAIKRKGAVEAELQKKMLDLEKKALLAQMNPHFIFNAMNSIQEYIFDGDNEGAMKYLTKFSRLLRKVIQASSHQHIALNSEVQLIRDYIELEQMRFPEKFDYTISVDPEIDINSVEISPFIIQPQVENAILHGLLNKSGKGRIDIAIIKEDKGLKVTVSDNGIGREKAAELRLANKFKHTGRATSIVKQRLMHNEDINGRKPFVINDLYGDNGEPLGTTVEMLISTH